MDTERLLMGADQTALALALRVAYRKRDWATIPKIIEALEGAREARELLRDDSLPDAALVALGDLSDRYKGGLPEDSPWGEVAHFIVAGLRRDRASRRAWRCLNLLESEEGTPSEVRAYIEEDVNTGPIYPGSTLDQGYPQGEVMQTEEILEEILGEPYEDYQMSEI